jgi:formylglycine-generating enzyme required for sulfatase activity/predicted Ser/Thr protein kinase
MAQAFRRIGKYELLEEIGRGGFAVVYRARDVELDRLVALKGLRPALGDDPDFVARFKREARAAAGLKHPNIVTVYDAAQIDGQLIIAMEYVEGHTLRDELHTQGALPLDRALEILEQIAGALDYAHQRGIVHRDVKPANILLEETAQSAHATLLDFGLAKALGASTVLTSQGTLLGSPEYMAPEQTDPGRANEIGPATDRYALGIVAYQLLTGRVPFQGNTPATLNAHLNLKPPDPRALRADVSPQVSGVLLKMLAKVPADRYASAREFVQGLRIAAKPLAPPVRAKRAEGERPGRQERQVESPVREAPRKNPRWVWGMLLGVLAVIVVGVIVIAIGSQPSNLGVGSTRTRAADGMVMVYVPGGTFKMGSDNGESDQKPVHSVTLDAFWIDRTEVTNAQYAKCVAAKQCAEPSEKTSNTRASYYGNPDFANYPVIYVSWDDANKYCGWAGGQLPTEAQWEYAARGPQSYTYPWGNDPPNDKLLNYNRYVADTTEVGSYPRGASWVGALDMAGNVWEWVEDWYASYPDLPQTNPTGPTSGNYRVLRGGSWRDYAPSVRSASLYYDTPASRSALVGFRCVAAPGE